MPFVTLIVVEPGSEWPGHIGDAEQVVAVGYDQEGLLSKTRERLELLRRRGELVRAAVLVCSGAANSVFAAQRVDIARELISAVSGVGSGRVVLCSSGDASTSERRELLSLAGTLCQELSCPELRGRAIEVSVRFGAGERQPIGRAKRQPFAALA
jgi:hypothetical protein